MKPDRQAFLHIGMEKTGTTTIQSFMANNREGLRRRAVAYPETPGHANHLKLNAYALNDDVFDDTRTRYGVHDASDLHAFRQEFRAQLAAEIARLEDCRKFVFSNEHCSARLTTSEEANRLLTVFEPHFSDIRVILYLREQGGNMASSYSTKLRNGSSHLPEDDEIEWEKYEYYHRVKRWSDQVGRSNLDVRVYERKAFVAGDLLLDFFDAIEEIEENGDYFMPDRKNERLGASTLEMIRTFNELAPSLLDSEDIPEARGNLVRALEQLPQGATLAFPEEKLAELRNQFSESNRRLAQEFFDRDFLFTTYESSSNDRDEVPWRELTREEVLDLMVRSAMTWNVRS